MKRKIFLMMAAVAALVAQAATLSPAQAIKRLKIDEARSPMLKSVTASAHPAFTATTADGSPAIYAFASGEGYVFVAADDVAVPLIGYTDGGSVDFGNLPTNMRSWLDMWAEIIAQVSANPEKYRSRRIAKPAAASFAAIEPIITTKWSQDAPYNNYCPESDGRHFYTGCVATAMAQVMNVHRYPSDFGKGSISYHPASWEGDEILSMDFSKLRFSWDDLVDDYSQSYTEAQADAVATLMKACGYSVMMDYTPNVSNSYAIDVENSLKTYFGYSSMATYRLRSYYDTEAWDGMLLDNLSKGYPVLYSGQSSTGGHAFVCDGSSADGLFHINWGWGGTANGYFSLDVLDPYYEPAGGYGSGYSISQGAIFNIYPAVDGETAPSRALNMGGAPDIDIKDGVMSISGSESYALMLYSRRELTFDCAVQFSKLDENRNRVGDPFYRTAYGDQGALENFTLPGFSEVDKVTCPMSGLEDGIYEIRLMTRDKNAPVQEWIPVLCPAIFQQSAYIKSENGEVTAFPGDADIDKVAFPVFEALSPIYPGRPIRLRTVAKNNGDKAITICFSAAMLINGHLAETMASQTITLQPGEEKEKIWLTQYAESTSLKAGDEVALMLVDKTCHIPYEGATLNSVVSEYNPDIEVEGMKVTGSKLIDGVYTVDSREIRFTGKLTAKKGCIMEEIALGLFNDDGSVIGYQDVSNGFIIVNEGESQDLSTTIFFKSATLGTHYVACLMRVVGDTMMPLVATAEGQNDPSTYLAFAITEPKGLKQPEAPFDFVTVKDLSMHTQASIGENCMPVWLDKDVEQYRPGIVAATITLSAADVPDEVPQVSDNRLCASLATMYGDSIKYKDVDLADFYGSMEMFDEFNKTYSQALMMKLAGRYERTVEIPGLGFTMRDTINFNEEPMARYMVDPTFKVGMPVSGRLLFSTGYPYDLSSLDGSEEATLRVLHHDMSTNEPSEWLSSTAPLRFNAGKREYLAVTDSTDFVLGDDVPLGLYTANVSANWGDIHTSFEFSVVDTLRAEVTLPNREFAPKATIAAGVRMNYGYPYVSAVGADKLPTVRIAAALRKKGGNEPALADTTVLADAALAYTDLDMTKEVSIDLSKCDFGTLPDAGVEYDLDITIIFNGERQYAVTNTVLITNKPVGVEPVSIREIEHDNAIYRIDGVRVDTTQGNLQPGIYISRGRKIVITR